MQKKKNLFWGIPVTIVAKGFVFNQKLSEIDTPE